MTPAAQKPPDEVSRSTSPVIPGAGEVQSAINTRNLLGVLNGTTLSDTEAHQLVADGLPAAAMSTLLNRLSILSTDLVLGVLGISTRSYARRKSKPRSTLSALESGRLWEFAEVLAHTTRVFGSQESAEAWLTRPAIALNGECPIELLKTPPGTRLVSQVLTRLEYDIYT